MNFKLIMALVANSHTDEVVEKARKMGATGTTVITSARGEGLEPAKCFLGLTLEGQVDVVLLLVERHMARNILEGISDTGHFKDEAGAGIAFQLDVEDAIGLNRQADIIKAEIGEKI